VKAEDIEIIYHQIKRRPKNVLNVVRYCNYGFPVVVKAFPILDGKPFPTLYWLTCPFLVGKISSIESDKGILKYEKLLEESSDLYDEHVKANLKARKIIFELIEKSDRIAMKFEESGFGGIKNFKHLKCLHLHVAYHLGGIENPVGRLVLSELGDEECSDGKCKKWITL
jgi:hypothetical protein